LAILWAAELVWGQREGDCILYRLNNGWLRVLLAGWLVMALM
jgi:hypothetical protein